MTHNQLYSWVDQDNDGNVVINFGSLLSNNYFQSMIVFTLSDWIKWIAFIKKLSLNHYHYHDHNNTSFTLGTFCNPIEFVGAPNEFTGEVVMLFWDTTTNNTITFSSLERFRNFCKFVCDFDYIDDRDC